MLSKEAVIVLCHYVEQGLSQTAIAQKLGVSRRTVYRYVKAGKTTPRYGPRAPRGSQLEPYRNYLQGRLRDLPELSVVRLLEELRLLGYQGGYTVLKDRIRTLRPRLFPPPELRFEVTPGEQAQVDFATFQTPFGTVYALLVVLSWSRTLWVRFNFHQDQLTVLSGLHHAFLAFGGVPRTALFDRMRTAVAGSEPDGKAIFNAEMLRFAAHCGFTPVACQPYRAKTKGRVERAVSYLRHSFFYGRTFRDLDDLNTQCAKWLAETANARVHGTTGEVPADRLILEWEHLRPLPQEPYVPMISLGRRVTRDGFISYNGNAYSVPEGLTRAEVEVLATLTEVRLFQDRKLLATHPLLLGHGQRRLAPEHQRRPAPSPFKEAPSSVPLELIEVQRRPLDLYERVLR